MRVEALSELVSFPPLSEMPRKAVDCLEYDRLHGQGKFRFFESVSRKVCWSFLVEGAPDVAQSCNYTLCTATHR